jgi:hypothetical protein
VAIGVLLLGVFVLISGIMSPADSSGHEGQQSDDLAVNAEANSERMDDDGKPDQTDA